MMTPQEIFEYKHTWLPSAHIKAIDEWSEYAVKHWCRQNIDQKDWHFIRYTDIYEHSVALRLEEDVLRFEAQFK